MAANDLFESDVIPDSGQTVMSKQLDSVKFESDVIPDSGQTEAEQTNI